LYAHFDRVVDDAQRTAYRELVRRAAQHEPVAYLVGEKEFFSLKLHVGPGVLIPRPESELLVTEAVEFLRAQGGLGSVWDVCTGSGCIAVAIAKQVPDATVLATDISAEAVALASRNAARHELDHRVRVREADLLARPPDCPEPDVFDVITANPPYVGDAEPVAECVKHEPDVALYAGPDGLAAIRPMIAGAPAHLRLGGLLVLEFGCGQADAVRDLIVDQDAFDEPRILLDHQELERVAVTVRVQ
jgi:release factor glutamine methyltransferase